VRQHCDTCIVSNVNDVTMKVKSVNIEALAQNKTKTLRFVSEIFKSKKTIGSTSCFLYLKKLKFRPMVTKHGDLVQIFQCRNKNVKI
jgi:hypothetical protein